MTYTASRRFPLIERFTALSLLASAVSGCSFTQTSTNIRSVSDAPVEHLRLTRSDESPITGTFKQDGHAVLGQLALSNDCARQAVHRVHRQIITETHSNRATAITWAIVGGVLTAVGTGFLIASQSADRHVTCGTGVDSSPKEGDECHSLSGAESELGYGTLLLGLLAGTTGVINLARKPQLETTQLPVQEVTQVTSPVACGNTAALEGLAVSVQLPGNGKWMGRVARDGSLRIDINDKIPIPDQAAVSVFVDAVPPGLADLVGIGAAIGTLTLTDGRAEPVHRKVANRR